MFSQFTLSVFSVHSLSRDSLNKNDCFAARKMLNFKQARGTHLLVDGQKVDVGLLHRQQKDKGVALVANTCRAPTAMHKSTKTKPHKKKKTAENTGTKKILQILCLYQSRPLSPSSPHGSKLIYLILLWLICSFIDHKHCSSLWFDTTDIMQLPQNMPKCGYIGH